ncbi:MAG: prenyltransferase/squalene oxidase repeat-containing protein [Aeromicrobium sp.]
MKSTLVRRLGAAVIAPTLTFGALAATTQSAQAAPNSYAYSAVRWLVDQLTDGLVVTGTTTRYGQSLDVFFALDGLDVRESTATGIIDAFKPVQTEYTTGEAFGDTGSHYVGATAKLATAVYASGQNPSSFGGHDLIADLTDLVQTSGDEDGRLSDESMYGDNSNTLGQGFAVRALAAAASPELADATAYLLKQQCPDGSFRTFEFTVAVPDPDYPIDAVDRVCGEGPTTGDDSISVDATAYSIQALLAAKAAGVASLDDDIDQAVAWLKAEQADDGSFEDLGTANSSSTGLAAATLKIVGEPGAAAAAASWVVGRQVTDAVGEDTALANELGAVAPNDAFLADGKTDGITSATRVNWVIATAQAALGVDAQLPATTLTVTAPTTYVSGGTNATVSVAGLIEGEKFSASFGGVAIVGTANASGEGSVAVPTPTTTGAKTVTVVGSRAVRKGTATVQVLGAKALTPRVVYSSVRAGGTQRVTISGLAPNEPLRIGYGGKFIKTTTASSTGTFGYSFNVGSSKGTKSVKVYGAFSNRSGSTSFTVK